MTIDVVLALPHRCLRRRVRAAPGITAGEAAGRSGLLEVCEHEAGETPLLGVYGRKVNADYRLKPGERLELYRSLTVDPRARRRARVESRRDRSPD